MTAGIYVIRHVATGRIYLGSSRDILRRRSEHLSRLRRGVHGNAKLQAAWNKYGEDAFEFEPVFSVFDPEHLESVEQQFLDEHQAVARGFNLSPTAGNTAGWRASPETRERMSEAARSRDHSKALAAMHAAVKGRKRPKEEIDRIWETRRRNAKPLSDDARARMSASARARGSNITPEHQALLVQLAKARARFTADDMANMASMRAGGASLKAIGQAFGITALSSVSMYLRKARQT